MSRWLPAHYTERELRHMFRKADLNGDELIDLNEFVHMQWRRTGALDMLTLPLTLTLTLTLNLT